MYTNTSLTRTDKWHNDFMQKVLPKYWSNRLQNVLGKGKGPSIHIHSQNVSPHFNIWIFLTEARNFFAVCILCRKKMSQFFFKIQLTFLGCVYVIIDIVMNSSLSFRLCLSVSLCETAQKSINCQSIASTGGWRGSEMSAGGWKGVGWSCLKEDEGARSCQHKVSIKCYITLTLVSKERCHFF